MTAAKAGGDRITQLAKRPKSEPPLVMVTAYDVASARIADAAGVDLILVGDSAATNVLGYETTRDIPLDELLMLTRAVRRGTRDALLVGDLPFGTYEQSSMQAVATAKQFAEAGCDLVKLEGAGAMLDRVRAIIASGIPVIGHVGLLPQSARTSAELRARGRTAVEAVAIVKDAVSLAGVGCSALVVEAVPAVVAQAVTTRVACPVIGIGAGAQVDGQVLVWHDLLGIGDGHLPKFVRPYATLREQTLSALRAFAQDVRGREFPSPAEEYGMPPDEAAEFTRKLR